MKKNPIKHLLKTAFLLAVVLFRFEGFGQISVTSSTPYTQNFNSYAGSSASLPTGWSATGTFTYRGAGNGSSTTGGAWAFGATAGQEDLGALTSGTSSDIVYSVSFVNNTGSAITSLVISFNFDQWANNGGNTNGFTVSGTGALNTSPINSSLNTNLSTNSCISSCGTLPNSTIKTYTLTGLSIANGTSYGLSWEDIDGTGSDNPIGIDNFSITAIACATPTLSVTGTQTICAGQTTTLTVSGASTYSWSAGATTASVTISPTTTTVYTVSGTSSGGCTATKTVTVTVNSNPTISVVGTQTICSGQTTTLTASGASTYTWSTSATTATVALNPTTTSVYTVTGTNSNGCKGINNPTVTVISTPTVNVSGTQTICVGQTATLTASGASTYTWSTGANTAAVNVTPTTTTVYTVTGSNGTACSNNIKTATVTVTYSASLSTTRTNIACYGSSTGSINLTTTGGTSPFTYSWTGPSGYTSSTQNISGLAAGSYSVVVTSTGGCTSSTLTTITQPSVALSVQANGSVSSAACNNGAKGSVILVVSGGNTPYSYSWSNGSTSQNQSNLTAGIYSVTVTDANGCTATTSVDFSSLGTKISTFPYAQSFESGAGGWITGALNQTIGGVSNQYVNDWATGVPSKSHITTAGDGSKCWITGGLTGSFYDFYEKSYVQSPVLNLTGLQYPVLSFMLYRESEYQYDGANVSYSTDGGSTWTVLGAYNDSTDCNTKNWYNYSGINYLGASSPEDGWSGNVEASYTDPNDNTNTCQGGHGSGGWVRVKHCLTGLAGNSCVMLRFNYGAGFKCNNYDGFAFDSVAVSNGIATSPHYTYACSGVNTLSFTASNSSCVKATSWNWNFGDASSGSNTSTSTNPTHVFSQPGTYTVSLSTNGACNPTGTYTSAVTVFGPSISGTQTVCSGQSTTLTASGASTYTWSTGAHTSTITVSPTTTISYTVSSNGSGSCVGSSVITITVNPSFTITTTHTNIACNGSSNGSINLTTTGGTSPFTYSWTGSSGYTSSTQNISGLAAGSYSVLVTSATGCSSSTVTTITQPSVALSVQADASVSSAACNSGAKGSVILVVNGGNTPYSYSWSNGSSIQNQSNLTAGIYSVTVTDANGCTATTSVDFSSLGTKIASFPYTQSFESGAGGWITGALNQTIGGVSNQYINDWACGAPSKSHITTGGDGSKCWVTGGLTGSFYDFYEKSYVQSPVFDFTGLQYPVLSFKLYRESEYQYDGANVSYSTNGGTTWTVLGAYNDSTDCDTKNWYNYSGITYLGASSPEDGWSGNVEASYTDPSDNTNTCQGGHGSGGWVNVKHCLTGLAGNSCVMLRFNYGAGFKCNNYDGFAFDSVAVGNGITTSPHFTSSCSGVNTLSFTASNSSCVKATSWNWNFGDASSGSNTSTSTNPTHVFTQPGTYTVSLSTNGACNPAGTYTSAVTVFGPSISGTQTVCSGQSTTLTASSASSYTWSTGAHTASITATPTTTTSYTVTGTGSGGCVGSSVITVTVNPSFTITTTHTNIACNGASTGAINLTTTGGTSPFTYSWTGPIGYTSSTQNVSGLAVGSYSVLVTSTGGCTSSTVTTITQPSVALSVQANASESNACNTSATGSIILVVSGGNTPYSYNWSNGSTSQNQSSLSAGIYSVSVTDANGCVVTASSDLSSLGTKISTFPYTQSFESGAGGWITGALNQTIGGVSNQYVNDWATGVPSKSHITTSGDGSKCWVTGGLTGSFYDFYEKSYVQSPVLDLTGLQYPVLSFMLYRESEYKYDGANVSYSTNGGTTWTVLGAYNDSTDCNTKNWYNYSGINYLGASNNEDGWSGNVEASYTDPNDNTNTCQGGHGSGGWVRVKHCLTGLAGNSCVMLRFNYGAGFKCNNYDGFAFDSVAVSNGIATSPHYTYACSGVNTLSFTASNSSCIKATSWSWNFGDASSGSNTSTSTNPTHVFSQPGTYTVSLSTNGACNPAGTYTSAVTVFGPSISGTQTICSGQSTTLTASGASTYTWSTGVHTSTINSKSNYNNSFIL